MKHYKCKKSYFFLYLKIQHKCLCVSITYFILSWLFTLFSYTESGRLKLRVTIRKLEPDLYDVSDVPSESSLRTNRLKYLLILPGEKHFVVLICHFNFASSSQNYYSYLLLIFFNFAMSIKSLILQFLQFLVSYSQFWFRNVLLHNFFGSSIETGCIKSLCWIKYLFFKEVFTLILLVTI